MRQAGSRLFTATIHTGSRHFYSVRHSQLPPFVQPQCDGPATSQFKQVHCDNPSSTLPIPRDRPTSIGSLLDVATCRSEPIQFRANSTTNRHARTVCIATSDHRCDRRRCHPARESFVACRRACRSRPDGDDLPRVRQQHRTWPLLRSELVAPRAPSLCSATVNARTRNEPRCRSADASRAPRCRSCCDVGRRRRCRAWFRSRARHRRVGLRAREALAEQPRLWSTCGRARASRWVAFFAIYDHPARRRTMPRRLGRSRAARRSQIVRLRARRQSDLRPHSRM